MLYWSHILILLTPFSTSLIYDPLRSLLTFESQSCKTSPCSTDNNSFNVEIDVGNDYSAIYQGSASNKTSGFWEIGFRQSSSLTTSTIAKLSITKNGNCYNVHWSKVYSSLFQIKDCIKLDASTWWFGGPELYDHHFSSRSGYGNNFQLQPFIVSDITLHKDKFGGASHPIWINSNGWTVTVTIPTSHNIKVSMNENFTNGVGESNRRMCFEPEIPMKYNESMFDHHVNVMDYELCSHLNVKTALYASRLKYPFHSDNRIFPHESYLDSVWHVDAILHSGTKKIMRVLCKLLEYHIITIPI